ncbi:hypothetical protein [Rhizobium sp. L1K21]|uniref:hypothetical protein n=1 Tax=Rhizobium sp. L1K21 TaxID=2954933 RepID=UPI00209388A6|nr:hypothetical protein [Rhizobium sp. L1K21]MCO6187843.1 hypothetical protein [Rhizobium sp. L1K21]
MKIEPRPNVTQKRHSEKKTQRAKTMEKTRKPDSPYPSVPLSEKGRGEVRVPASINGRNLSGGVL